MKKPIRILCVFLVLLIAVSAVACTVENDDPSNQTTQDEKRK